MTPRRMELLISAALALGALLVVSWLAIDGVAIAQGALIGALGAAVSHFLHTPQPAQLDEALRNRRASDPEPPVSRPPAPQPIRRIDP